MKTYTRRRFAILFSVLLACCGFMSVMNLCVPEHAKALVPDITMGSGNSDISKDSSDEEDSSEALLEDSTFSIKFIDVGQADAALVECDGHYMLIDGGNASDSNVIYAILKRLEVKKLDIIMVSHAHEDHVGGLSGALEYCSADLVLCPTDSYNSKAFENFKDRCEQQELEITIPEVGDTFELGCATIEILGVNANTPDDDDTDINNSSIICMITYGDTKVLFTGDAEDEAEAAVLASKADLSCDLLKVAHHGSSGASSKAFLAAADPDYAVISVGADNVYGHPTERVLSLLSSFGAQIFRTDLEGDIECTSDGSGLSFSVDVEVSEEELLEAGAVAATDVAEVAETKSESKTESGSEAVSESSEPQNTYILNTNSMKFHREGCRAVKKMSEKNKLVVTATRSEVINMGYDPCGICFP